MQGILAQLATAKFEITFLVSAVSALSVSTDEDPLLCAPSNRTALHAFNMHIKQRFNQCSKVKGLKFRKIYVGKSLSGVRREDVSQFHVCVLRAKTKNRVNHLQSTILNMSFLMCLIHTQTEKYKKISVQEG